MVLINLTLSDFIFILITGAVTFGSVLTSLFESILPNFVFQAFLYGKLSQKGIKSKIVRSFEVPKSWFKHMYILSAILSSITLTLYAYTYFGGVTPTFIIKFLDFVGGDDRQAQTSSTSTLLALVLMCAQCQRRFYESHYIQVFSPASKMSIWHYLLGLFHYFCINIAILIHGDGFASSSSNRHLDNGPNTIIINTILSAIFLFAWINQFKVNVILANLRKDKNTGSVVSYKHSIPRGGWFDLVSSPHMLFEVIMYCSIAGILYQNTSWWITTVFVFVNQTELALITHWWYQKTFENYPQRKAIYPHLL